jgi:hypothetical protein
MNKYALLSTAVLLACAPGCDGLASLEGTVTIDGKPAPAGVSLQFAPVTGKGSLSYASTDANGHYEAAFTFQKKGIQPGEHSVKLMPSQVETPMPKIGPAGRPVGPPPVSPLKNIPQEYYQEIQKITVEPGSNTINIDLKTEGEGEE